MFLGDWDAVARVAGDLMTVVDCYPERYRVADFPSASQLAEIRDAPLSQLVARWMSRRSRDLSMGS